MEKKYFMYYFRVRLGYDNFWPSNAASSSNEHKT